MISEPLLYNIHLTSNWYVYAFWAESTKRLSNTPPPSPRSNRPHHYHIYSPTRPPSEPAEPYGHFLRGSEDIIGPPLPGLLPKNVQAVEHLLYSLGNQNVRTTNRKDKLISPA